MIEAAHITGLVLAGGLGSRMGGVDKGLQTLRGTSLAQSAVERLGRQVGTVAVSANRHLDCYRAMGVEVWPDRSLPGFAGPLAGFVAGLEHCRTPFLATVPCDSPMFPDDLVLRLGKAFDAADIDIAVASTGGTGSPCLQPTFCLMRTGTLAALKRFVADGGRKIGFWVRSQRHAEVAFDDATAFVNINTLDELQRFQSASGAP